MSEVATPGLFDRTLRRIAGAWRDMAATVAREDDDSVAAQMRACLAARGGEISARNRAAKLAQTYLAQDDAGRAAFLRTLAAFDADPVAVADCVAALQQADGPDDRAAARARLRRVLEPPRVRLLRQFATIPDGMKFLVDLRAFLLTQAPQDPALAALEADLKPLLATWLDVGFIEVRRIDWDSPAALLEKLAGYEAVHGIRSWRDMKDRLDSDRRCYAVFHPRMPTEPLIFVEVALVRGLADSIQRLLDQKAPVLATAQADTAIFYSISNCQRGLAGISFGNFLIKQCVELLSAEFRGLRTFSTLSPIPGFLRWLRPLLAASDPAVLTAEEAASLLALGPGVLGEQAADEADAPAVLLACLARRHWWREPALLRVLEPVLARLAARYLTAESAGRRALDPVAHFHLSNGARIERINILADTSDKGARESATLMVNYLYDPARIEEYHETYAGDGGRNASAAVRRLARGVA